jgi:8-oxo-dGTP diphosphatase
MIKCQFEDGGEANLRHVTVNAIIVKDGKVLLGKRGTRNGKPILEFGKWGLTGGFMERDENLEESVRREALEETGWKIKNLKLFRINDNPRRPFEDRQNVDIIFLAEADQIVGKSDEEIRELQWFDIDDLPPKDQIAFDHADSLELYKKYLLKKFTLPFLGGQ